MFSKKIGDTSYKCKTHMGPMMFRGREWFKRFMLRPRKLGSTYPNSSGGLRTCSLVGQCQLLVNFALHRWLSWGYAGSDAAVLLDIAAAMDGSGWEKGDPTRASLRKEETPIQPVGPQWRVTVSIVKALLGRGHLAWNVVAWYPTLGCRVAL